MKLKKVKMPTISSSRLDTTPVNTQTGSSKEERRAKAVIKNQELTINTHVRIPESVYMKVDTLKMANRKSLNYIIVKALQDLISTPESKKQIKKFSKLQLARILQDEN